MQVQEPYPARKHSRIDTICLCQFGHGLGKASSLRWIYFMKASSLLAEMAFKSAMIRTSRLKNDQNIPVLIHPVAQSFKPFF